MCKVSVVIPVYNTEKYLRECLDSVINQTFRDIEIVVVDDGSQDGSPQICDEYAEKDNRVRVLHKKNGGLCAARNDGIRMSKSDRILFIDSDDYVLPNHIEYLYIEGLDKNDITQCGVMSNDLLGNWDLRLPYIMPYGYNENNDGIIKIREEHCFVINVRPDFIKEGYFGAPWNKLYSKDLIIENNLFFDEELKIREDTFFNLKYMKYVKRIIPIYNFSYCYRMVSGGITKGYNKNYELYERVWTSKLLDYIRNEDKMYLKRVVYLEIVCQYTMNLNRFYFNVNNEETYSERLQRVKDYINQNDIKLALSEVDMKCLSISQKIAVLAARSGNAMLVASVYYVKTIIKRYCKNGR